jgi:hypothetical protein
LHIKVLYKSIINVEIAQAPQCNCFFVSMKAPFTVPDSVRQLPDVNPAEAKTSGKMPTENHCWRA